MPIILANIYWVSALFQKHSKYFIYIIYFHLHNNHMVATLIFLFSNEESKDREVKYLSYNQLVSGGFIFEWWRQSSSTNLQGNMRSPAWILLQERVCYLPISIAVGHWCPTTMSEFLNKDYILSGCSADSCLKNVAEVLGFGISAYCESPLAGDFAPKPLWPDKKNLTDLYLSLKLFTEDRSGFHSEGFCFSLIKILHSKLQFRARLPETQLIHIFNHSIIMTIWKQSTVTMKLTIYINMSNTLNIIFSEGKIKLLELKKFA